MKKIETKETLEDGTVKYYLNDVLHREDGPAIVSYEGNKYWYINGKRHREDGPAIEYTNGHKEWWLNGKLHREDRPAVEYTNGDKEWWINGEKVPEPKQEEKRYSIAELKNMSVEEFLTLIK